MKLIDSGWIKNPSGWIQKPGKFPKVTFVVLNLYALHRVV